jgi:hypothetical protein
MGSKFDDVIFAMLHLWPDKGLACALALVAAVSRRPANAGVAAPLFNAASPVRWPTDDEPERHLLWIDAIELAARDSRTPRAWRQALLLASITLSFPAAEVFFNESDTLMRAIFRARAPSDPGYVIPLVQQHLNTWAARRYDDAEAFVGDFYRDWVLGSGRTTQY